MTQAPILDASAEAPEEIAPRRHLLPLARAERAPRVETTPIVVARRASLSRVHLLSVVKVAVVFWTCVGALVVGALFAAYTILTGAGAVEHAERFVADMTGLEEFRILSATILGALALLVSLFVVAAVTLTVVMAAFYNVLARFIGGVDVTMTEELARVPVLEAQQVAGVRSNGHASAASVS